MKSIQEKLSRAKNAKDATMNRTKPVILSAAKNLLSRSGHGPKLDPSLSLRMTMAVPFALTAIAATLLLATPAHAQVDPDCTGSNPGTVNCTATTYANGITHATNGGDVTVNSGNGVTSYGTGGFITNGVGDDNVTMTKGTGNLSNNATTGTRSPIVIGATSEAGDITITTTGTVQGAAAFVQYGISAESTVGGDIDITTTGSVSVSTASSSVGIAALRAITNGGNITLSNAALNGPIGGILQTSGAGAIVITGNANNYQATTQQGSIMAASGFGSFTTQSGDITVNSGARGVFTSQTGNITLGVAAGTLGTGGPAGIAGGTLVSTQTSGLTTLNFSGFNGPWGSGASNRVGMAAQSSGAGDVVVNTLGNDTFRLIGGPRDQDISVGSGLGRLSTAVASAFDFSQLGGSATLNFNAGTGWFLQTPNTLATGGNPVAQSAPINRLSNNGDVVNIAVNAVLSTPVSLSGFGPQPLGGISTLNTQAQREALLARPIEEFIYSADFGSGQDTLNMAGDLLIMPTYGTSLGNRDLFPAEMRLLNLDTVNLSGTIWMGAMFGNVFGNANNQDFQGITDSTPDDILTMRGAHFVGVLDADGAPLGRIRADADLGNIGQSGCGIEQRGGGDGKRLPVADCVDLRDGHATGRTLFVIAQRTPGDRGAYNPEGSVLVDTRGVNAELNDPLAFGIAPETPEYVELADGTGAIDKGLFFYTVAYDPEAEQYKLYGLQGQGTQQFPLLMTATNRLWQRAAGGWFDRQVDQRDLVAGTEVSRGLWFRMSTGSTDRDLATPITGGGTTFLFDNSYSQEDVTTTMGWDWIGQANEKGALVAGGMVGYARAKLDFDASPNTANLEGMHAGLYGSLTLGGFYVDAAINQLWLDIDNDVPAMKLEPTTAILGTRASSIGGRLESGWRIPLGPVQIEPLAGLSWVKSKIDDMRVPAGDPDPARVGGDVRFHGVSNNNLSYGLRLSMENLFTQFAPTGFSLTARAIDEIHGSSKVSVGNRGPIAAPATDELEGTYTQISGSVHVSNTSRTLAGYVNVDSLDGDELSSVGFSAGLRYQW